MSQEIELKLLVDGASKEKVVELCQSLAKDAEQVTMELGNRYFDTADLRLRQHDMEYKQQKKDSGIG